MKLKSFNSGKNHFKLNLKKNKGKIIQYGTLAMSIVLLIVGIVFLSYAKFTANDDDESFNASVGEFYEGQYKLAVYLNTIKQDAIPSRTYEEGGITKTAYVRNIQCSDGAAGRWDTELWNLTVSGSTKSGTKCEIYFDNDSAKGDDSKFATKYSPFPVGFVYISTVNEEDGKPYELVLHDRFGGTWIPMNTGNYLRLRNDLVGESGGSNTATVQMKGEVQGHKLLTAQMPSHTHTFTGTSTNTGNNSVTPTASFSGTSTNTSSAGAHSHTRGSMNINGQMNFRGLNQPEPLTSNLSPLLSISGAFTSTRHTTSSGSGTNMVNNTWISGTGVPYYKVEFNANKNWSGSTSSNGAHTHTVTAKGTVSLANTTHTHAVTAKGTNAKTGGDENHTHGFKLTIKGNADASETAMTCAESGCTSMLTANVTTEPSYTGIYAYKRVADPE